MIQKNLLIIALFLPWILIGCNITTSDLPTSAPTGLAIPANTKLPIPTTNNDLDDKSENNDIGTQEVFYEYQENLLA